MKANDQVVIVDICKQRISALDMIWKTLADVWEKDDEQYNNQINESYYHGAANMKVPATYDAIETLVSFGVNALYSKDKVPVKSRAPEGGDAAKVKLYNRASEIKMSRINLREKIALTLRRYQKFGLAVVKKPYNADIMGADYIPLHPNEVRFDPFVPSMEELDFFAHKVKRTKRQLRKTYGEIDEKRLDEVTANNSAGNPEGVYQHTKTAFNIGSAKIVSNVKYYDVYECWVLAKTSEDNDERWYLATIVNNDYAIRIVTAPYELPFLVCGLIHQEGTILAKSLPRVIRDHQIALNDYHNQTLDCGTIALQPMSTVDTMANVTTSQMKFRPGGYVFTDAPNGIQPIRRDLRPDIGMMMQTNMENAIQRLTGATPSLMDALVKDVVATESRRAYNAATRRALEQLRKFVDVILVPWHRTDFNYTRRFVTYADFMRLVGKDAALEGEASLHEFFNEEYDSIAEGFLDITDKMARLQMLMNFYNLSTKSPMVANLPYMLRDIAEWQGIEDPDRYVFLPPSPQLMNPLDENTLMSQGQKVGVNPRDPHMEHINKHKAMEMPTDPELHAAVLALMDEHVGQHMRALQAQAGQQAGQQAAMPPQEMPQLQPQQGQEAELLGEGMRTPTTF